MVGIECICIDDANKPLEIPLEKWVKKGEKYTITHVFVMMQQNKIQGCELAEFDISDCIPYNCYRLTRFAIQEHDIVKLVELIKNCNQLNDIEINIEELIKDVPKAL